MTRCFRGQFWPLMLFMPLSPQNLQGMEAVTIGAALQPHPRGLFCALLPLNGSSGLSKPVRSEHTWRVHTCTLAKPLPGSLPTANQG